MRVGTALSPVRSQHHPVKRNRRASISEDMVAGLQGPIRGGACIPDHPDVAQDVFREAWDKVDPVSRERRITPISQQSLVLRTGEIPEDVRRRILSAPIAELDARGRNAEGDFRFLNRSRQLLTVCLSGGYENAPLATGGVPLTMSGLVRCRN